MEGIESIIKSIEQDSKNKCKKFLEDTDIEIKELKKKLKELTNTKIKFMIEEHEKNIKLIFKKGKSFCEDFKKKEVLNTKNKLISDVIEKTKDFIINSDRKKYFLLLLDFVNKFQLNRIGEIVFSKKDFEELPENFEKKINEISKGKLKISTLTKDINGGFILVYNNLEENCSIDAIFKINYEVLRDVANSSLFEF